jgi:hypothetical protein
MAGVEKWEMQFYCSFMNKMKTPGGLAADREQRGDIRFMFILTKKNRFFNAGYALPDIINSYEEYQKFHNLDLQDMDIFFLWQELFKVKMALVHINPYQQPWLFVEPGKFIPALEWLKVRYKAVKEELKRRERKSA